VVVIRHPIELVYSWYKSGRGKRFGTDQRFIHPTIKTKNGVSVPLFLADKYEEYEVANELERCVLSIENEMKKYFEIYKVEKKHSNVYWLDFDRFSENPELHLKEIANIFNSEITIRTLEAKKKSRIPRVYDSDLLNLKYESIKAQISNKYVIRLNTLIEMYQNSFEFDVNNKCMTTTRVDQTYNNINIKNMTARPMYLRGVRIN
jgi:hypothetical protein